MVLGHHHRDEHAGQDHGEDEHADDDRGEDEHGDQEADLLWQLVMMHSVQEIPWRQKHELGIWQ